MNLYYFQPETQQEHLALLRSLNLNEKIISKQEEEKLNKRRLKFAECLLAMYTLFNEKITKLLTMGIYQRAFGQSYRLSRKPLTIDEEALKILLRGFFFTSIYNDPLIRYSTNGFHSWMKNPLNKNSSNLECLLLYKKMMDLH